MSDKITTITNPTFKKDAIVRITSSGGNYSRWVAAAKHFLGEDFDFKSKNIFSDHLERFSYNVVGAIQHPSHRERKEIVILSRVGRPYATAVAVMGVECLELDLDAPQPKKSVISTTDEDILLL